MESGGTTSSRGTDAVRSVSDLYAGLTELVLTKNPVHLSIHRGLWGPDTKTNAEGLDRANRTLLRGCRLGPGQHVLDAGCGVGGTAIFLAEHCGVTVTGLTNCEPHVAVATRKAHERGVADLVEFKFGDFMEMPFPDAGFDAVLNHESFCYAVDKPAYLRSVYRVLKPGGRWQVLEAELLKENGPRLERHDALLAAVERNWRLPPMGSWPDVLAMVEEAGFTRIEEQDLSAEALPSADRIRQGFLSVSFLNPQLRETNPAFQEFMDASVAYAEGLSEGLFTYRFISAMRPVRQQQSR